MIKLYICCLVLIIGSVEVGPDIDMKFYQEVMEIVSYDMYLVRKSKSISSTFLLCLQKDDNFENSRDQENATLMLYHNICNIWCKYKVQMSYKVVKILSMLFISCRLHTKCIQLYKYVVIKYISCCNYSKTYRYKRYKMFQ